MTSSILNFVFENFLSSIVEIDKSKTSASIFSGEIELNNLKIKDEIFQNLNIPYVEVVHGYVGSLKISLKMPFFYDNAINVFVDKIFFHARLKNINKLNKEEEIKNMEELKKNQLLKTEQIMAQVDDVKRQNQESENKKTKEHSPGLVQKIINNLSVEINDVVFKFDDETSYPETPYSIGVILDSVNIRSTRNDFKIPENKEEVIPYEEVNFKAVVVDNFSIYMDCFDSKEELDFERLISNKISHKIKVVELRNYLKDQYGFYTYCMSEVYVHSRKFDSHQYLLHQLDLSIKVALNDNVNNKEPKISAKVGFPQILLGISLKQIKTLLKVYAYMNLNTLYQRGIQREYYNKELTQNEKRSYIEGYLSYYQKKYINKEKIDFPIALEQLEDHLDYNKISELRSKALEKLDFINKINEISNKIQKEENRFFGKKEEIIRKLNEEKMRIMRMEEEFTKGHKEELEKISELEQDEFKDLDDTYVKIYALVDILITSFTIYETVNKNADGTWELKDKLLSIVIQHFGVECKIQKVGLIALLSLENIIIAQEKIKNPNYNKIFFGDLTIKGKLLCIIFEMNPKLKKSDIRVKVWSERQVYIIVDSYTLQYILYQIKEVLSTTIDLEEASSYAKGSIYNYIQEGYHDRVIEGNFTHTNLYLDVSLSCPIIIIPVDVFDSNNTNCILLSLGSLKLKSILPPRVDKKINYQIVEDENILYDIYRIGILRIRMATVENCIEKNNYVGNETLLLKDFDFSIECKLLIQPKNPKFHNMIINLTIPEIDFELNEFQILLLIEFLGNLTNEGNKLNTEMEILKRREKRNKLETLKRFKEKEMLNLTEKEKKEQEEEREEKIKKKQEEIKKNRLNENIKRAKVVYEKVIKAFSMSDHSIATYEIRNVKKGKKAIVVNFVIGKARFAIRKMFMDLSIEDYLVFQIDIIKVEVDIMVDGIMLIYFLIKHISLNDVDKDERKQLYLNPNYVCLVESTKENQIGSYNNFDKKSKYCFIELYLLMLGEEKDITINMNDLHIIFSLNSMIRLYQFGMYYFEIYSITMFNVENEKIILQRSLNKSLIKIGIEEEVKERNEESIKNEINKEYMARLKKYIKNIYTVDHAKDYIKKRNKTKTLDDYISYFADAESSEKGRKVFVTSERNRSKLRLIFNMNNTMFKLPLDPNKLDEPLFSMYFDLTFTMDKTSVYDDIISLPSKKILAQIYETNTSHMHVSLSSFELDMVYFMQNTKHFTHNIASERLVSNFRFKCNIDSYIAPYTEQSIMNIDVEMEPILLAFGMRQVRKLMLLSNLALGILPKLEEKYFPFIKPENIQNGVINIPKRKRQNMKQIIRRVVIRNQFKKILKQKMKEVKEKDKKSKRLFINTNRFNNHMELGCKIDKICLILFDNTLESKTIMLEINLTKLMIKMKTNSKVRNKDNMSLALYEMLTAEILPRTQFNLNQLSTYIDVLFSLDANYFNLTINDFEPLIERFNMGVNMIQVAPFCKLKGYVTTNDIINFNLATDGVIALNKFLLTFMQDEKMWQKDTINIYAPMLSSGIQKNIQKEMQEEIVLKFLNYTGLDLVFYFDDNPNYKISMKQNGKMNFTRINLYKARGQDRYKNPYQKTTFSLSIKESLPIEHINFQRNNYKQYKVNVQNSDGKTYPIYFSVKVESSGITNTVTFCPSLSFHNDTLFDTIILSINNKNVPINNIVIPKEKSEYIPLTWLMCDYPESSISIKLSQNGEFTQICSNISEFIVEPITDEVILQERNSMKNKVQKAFPDANNPTFIKMIDIIKSEYDNRKNSKSFVINDNGSKKCINLDYFILQSKDFKQNEINELNQKKENKDNINNDANTSVIDLYPKNNPNVYYDYEYIVYIRSLITIVNKIPFTINLSCSEGNKIIETLEKVCLYNENTNDMKITIEYNNDIYTSNSFMLNEENMYIELTSNTSNNIKCHVFRNPVKLVIPNPQKFYCDLKDYSIQSYEYTFFFDYLFNNRLTRKLWICPCQTKGIKGLKDFEINQKVLELKPSSINLLSLPDYEPNLSIKDENSPWSESFNINTIGVEGTIKLDTTNYPVAPGTIGKSQYNGGGGIFQTTNEIACLLSGSEIYDFSVIVVFEPKYIIINNLGFDIVYKQENYNNIYPLRSKDYHGLMYEKGEKDFRIGINDTTNQLIYYSGIFNLENELDADLKIKINRKSPIFNREMKIFTYDSVEYYILIRVINQSYDKGTVFILLTHPIFPYLEISNLTNTPIRIYEEGTNGIIINNNPKVTAVPFVWENTKKHKDKLFFEIYERVGNFNYSIFKEELLKINERATTLIYSVSCKNKNATRRFTIKEKEMLTKHEIDELKLYLRDKKRPKSNYFDIFIRGFGLSIIDNTPHELFYISLYNINLKYISNVLITNKESQSENTMNIILYIDNIQIDYCLNDSLKTVLSPKVQIVPSIEADVRKAMKEQNEKIVPFMSVLLTMTTKKNYFIGEEFTAYDQIDFVLQEFDIKVEQYALMNLSKLVMEMIGAFDFAQKTQMKDDKEPLLDIEMHIPLKKLTNENENSTMQLIRYLLIGALKFNLTLRLDLSSIPLGLPKAVKRIIGTIGNTLGRITDCPLHFNEKVIENVYLSWSDVSMKIINSYVTQGITQIYKILGSLDIIGNPVKLVRNVGGGFYDFVNEPRKGFRNGPKEFGIGVAKGFGGLISGIFGGIFDFVQRITGTLYAATQTITGKDRDSMSIEDENEPSNILSGFGEGFIGFGKEIGKGFYSCCAEPCKKASIYGATGFCKGLCIGILRLVISPFAGILKLVTCIMAGCKNSCYVLTGKKRLKTTRFRHPRVIVEGDKKLLPYEENKAEARESLYQLEKIDTHNILFAEDFICSECPRKISSAILTDKYMYVIYNLQKIVFKLDLRKVANTYVHYIDDKFFMAFKLKDNKIKGFPLRYDYSNVATGLQDILYHMFNKSQIMYSPDGIQGPELTYDNTTKNDLIDKSSYNTLIGEQSVYSDKTLFSKITLKNNLKSQKIVSENESVKQLNPHRSNDYVSLKVK